MSRGGYDADGQFLGSPTQAQRRPNIVIVLIDTLRADAVAHMPYLRSLAAQGVSFLDATAPTSWTQPSITSLLTGLLPHKHGADTPGDARPLPGAITTFPEVLRRAYGYQTAAFMGGKWFDDSQGTLQGFETRHGDYLLRGATEILAPWVAKRVQQAPQLLFLHTYEAHDPYGARNHPWPVRAPIHPQAHAVAAGGDVPADRWQEVWQFLTDTVARETVRGQRDRQALNRIVQWTLRGCELDPRPDILERLRAEYEQGVTWVDGNLRTTCEWLKAQGVLNAESILVVTSDHGEAFGEHGMIGHGRRLDDELVRIPLIIRGPGPFSGGRTVSGTVGLIDLFPTLLDYMGAEGIPGVDGLSVLAGLKAGEVRDRPVVSEVRAVPQTLGEPRSWVRTALRTTRWKWELVYDVGDGTLAEHVFDLHADPGAMRDLVTATGELPAALTSDPLLCGEIEALRDRCWGEARATAARAYSLYGVDVGPLVTERPASCWPRDTAPPVIPPAPPR
ncbi:MAG: sulfatase [Planctomycetota bacterium]|nr:sulfatase [Planctomycetota bacterium]